MAFFTLVQGSVFVTSATTLPASTPIQILEKGTQGPKGSSGFVSVTNPVDLRTFPLVPDLVTGELAYVSSRFIQFMLLQSYATADDGTDVILASDGVRKWVSIPTVPLQPGGVATYVLTANGPGVNPTWVKPHPDGEVIVVANPAALGTTPVAADLSDGMIAYVLSRALHYKFNASSGAVADGTDIIVGASGGAGRWLATSIIPLQPGTATHVLTNNGPGLNPTWQLPSGGPPSGVAGGDLQGTYPNPTVKSLTGAAGTLQVAATASIFNWATTAVPLLRLTAIGAGAGNPFSILGQTTVGAPGGDISLTPGGGTPAGNIRFNNVTLGNLLHWDSPTGRFNWSASAISPGSGQDIAPLGGGVNRIERTQAAFPTGGSAGGSFLFVVGALDGGGGLANFRFSRETVPAGLFFDGLEILPGATQNSNLSINKYGINGNFSVGFVTATSGTFGGGLFLTAQGGAAGAGGDLIATAGAAVGGDGGNLIASAGAASGVGFSGGAVSIAAGSANNVGGLGGSISLSAGANSGAGGTGGDVTLTAGNSTGVVGGFVTIRPGAGTPGGVVRITNAAGARKISYVSSTDRAHFSVPISGDSTIPVPLKLGAVIIDVTARVSPFVLSAVENEAGVFVFEGTQGANFVVRLPDDFGQIKYVRNNTNRQIAFQTVTGATPTPNLAIGAQATYFVGYLVAPGVTTQVIRI